MEATKLFFEDFVAGQRFTSREQAMTGERIVSFAAEFDPQPAHLGEEAAKDSAFGELVASGWHTAAISMRLQHEAVFGRIAEGGSGAAIERLAWPRPVRPGETLHVVVEIVDVAPSSGRPDEGVVTFSTTTLNGDGHTVETMLGTVIVPRRKQS